VKIITQKLRKNYATSWETRHFTKITQKLRILRKNYAYYANAKKLRRLRTPHFADGVFEEHKHMHGVSKEIDSGSGAGNLW